jgi:hypothetical protein
MGGAGNPKAKSPIGFLPFVEMLAAHDRHQQACSFVARLSDVIDRVEWFVRLDNFQAAIDDAYREESPELIDQILRKAKNTTVVEYGQSKLRALRQ